MKQDLIILGGGVTGLAAGLASGAPVYEAVSAPGGICSSYYVRPGERARLADAPDDGEAYRFEIGGGHWIFGGDPTVLRFLRSLTPMRSYERSSAVYFREQDLYVPFPLQNYLRRLDPAIVQRALAEMARPEGASATMKEWLGRSFGPTLCELFFNPFHALYTAGLYDRIAPQDAYKSPVDLRTVIRGAFDEAPAVGYNTTFLYPEEGLNRVAQKMAARCDLRYGKRVAAIDAVRRVVGFEDGSEAGYERLLSTLPLNRMLEMTGIEVGVVADPYTSVLVLNIGAVRGERCPDEQWLYNPDTRAGFHRVGFYSHVDRSFLPKSAREGGERVSIYVERAYVGGTRPGEEEAAGYAAEVVAELQEWGYIGEAEVVDPTWIDVAYTWSWPGSRWRGAAMKALEEREIYPVGRYARWVFQGISDSIRDGFYAGQGLR